MLEWDLQNRTFDISEDSKRCLKWKLRSDWEEVAAINNLQIHIFSWITHFDYNCMKQNLTFIFDEPLQPRSQAQIYSESLWYFDLRLTYTIHNLKATCQRHGIMWNVYHILTFSILLVAMMVYVYDKIYMGGHSRSSWNMTSLRNPVTRIFII